MKLNKIDQSINQISELLINILPERHCSIQGNGILYHKQKDLKINDDIIKLLKSIVLDSDLEIMIGYWNDMFNRIHLFKVKKDDRSLTKLEKLKNQIFINKGGIILNLLEYNDRITIRKDILEYKDT